MSRNSSGVYTLPAGNPVITGTVIASTWANPTMSDIANEITNSVDRAGRGSPLANLPMGGFKHTGVASATGAGQYLAYGQTGASLTSLTVGDTTTGRTNLIAGQLNVGVGQVISTNATEVWSAAAQPFYLGTSGAQGLGFITNSLVRMSISSAGDIGVGTGSPQRRIEATAASGEVWVRASTGGGSSTSFRGFDIGILGSAQSYGSFAMQLDTGEARLTAGYSGYGGFQTFHTNGSERGRITPAGAWLINGPTAPATGATLQNGAGTGIARTVTWTNDPYAYQARNGADAGVWWGASNSTTPDHIWLNTAGTELLRLTHGGRLYGTALHNNPGSMTGTTTQYIGSGTYTPTVTNTANLTSITSRRAQWLRVGNVVTVSGSFTATISGVSALPHVSLPIASNLTDTAALSGTAVSNSSSAAPVGPNPALNAAEIFLSNPGGATLVGVDFRYHFTYEVR